MTYLLEKGITNFFDVIETNWGTEQKKSIDFEDFFKWLANHIQHEIRVKNITHEECGYLFKFSAPYSENIKNQE